VTKAAATTGGGRRGGTALTPTGADSHILRLARGAREILGRELSTEETDAFSCYIRLLVAWQRTFRLVGSAEPQWIVDELLLDSLLFVRFLPPAATRVLDLGSGAGVPGIPLRIVSRSLHLTLLEARRRRASFLSAATRSLGFKDEVVVCARAEAVLSLVPEMRGAFDAVVSRCAGHLEEALVLAEPFLAPGGTLVISGPPAPPAAGGPGMWASAEHPTKKITRSFFIATAA